MGLINDKIQRLRNYSIIIALFLRHELGPIYSNDCSLIKKSLNLVENLRKKVNLGEFKLFVPKSILKKI